MLKKLMGLIIFLMVFSLAAPAPVYAADTYTISGAITSGDPAVGLAGVTVTFAGLTAVTGADGEYTFTDVPAGAKGSIVPALVGYTFNPRSLRVTTLKSDLTGKDFKATFVGYTIRGTVTGGGSALKGAEVTASAAGEDPIVVLSGAKGGYVLKGLVPGLDYTISVVMPGYTFTPNLMDVPGIDGNQRMNFRGLVENRTITGVISGLAAGDTVQVRYGKLRSQVVTTEPGTGAFTISEVPGNKTYTLMPVSDKYRFAPETIVIAPGNNDLSGQNFTAAEQVWMSGTVKVNNRAVRGVTVSAAGFSTLTDSRGRYRLMVPLGASVTPTAENRYFRFDPGTTVTTSADFTQDWTSATVEVTGKVMEGTTGLSGVTVTAGSASAVTGADGTYVMTVEDTDVSNLASFAIRPQALDGFRFLPQSRVVNPYRGTGSTDFQALRRTYYVTGRVTWDNQGVKGVLITHGTHKAVTNANGVYYLRGIPFGETVNLTATKYGYSFAAVEPFVMPGANVTGKDITATKDDIACAVRGDIFLADGTRVQGVTVRLWYNGKILRSMQSTSSGHYSFHNLAATSGYQVEAVKTGYTFDPAGRVNIDVTHGDVTLNFTATPGAAPANAPID